MEIAGLPIPAVSNQVRGHPVRAEVRRPHPVPAMPAEPPPRDPAEQVLQGELLQNQRRREGARARDPFAEYLTRDQHPAFYPRQNNDALVQRRALAAYQSHQNIEPNPGPARSRIDYFI